MPTDPDGADWRGAASAPTAHPDTRPPLDWARAVFEGAPAPVRALLSLSWRWLLLLDVEPATTDRVLGWRVAEPPRPDAAAVLVAHSRWGLDSRLAISVEDGRLFLRTAVRYRRRGARALWAVVAPMHRVIVRLLVTRAARR